MHRWRYPSLSLHGIEGAFSGSGAKTVIPRKVNGKFSIRLVPNMDPDVVEKLVGNFVCPYLSLYDAEMVVASVITCSCTTNTCGSCATGHRLSAEGVCQTGKP